VVQDTRARMSVRKYGNWIANEWLQRGDDHVIERRSPAHGATLAYFASTPRKIGPVVRALERSLRSAIDCPVARLNCGRGGTAGCHRGGRNRETNPLRSSRDQLGSRTWPLCRRPCLTNRGGGCCTFGCFEFRPRDTLVNHPDVQMISFSGSSDAGGDSAGWQGWSSGERNQCGHRHRSSCRRHPGQSSRRADDILHRIERRRPEDRAYSGRATQARQPGTRRQGRQCGVADADIDAALDGVLFSYILNIRARIASKGGG